MPARASRQHIAGPAGRIEVEIDTPETAPKGVALVAHPHPLYGGALDNKVVFTIARAYAELGWVALRPNFRGVGESEGRHDEGRGEIDDLAAVLAWGETEHAGLPLLLAGYSFGAAIQTHLAERLRAAGRPPARIILVGPAVGGGRAHPSLPSPALVIHGEEDSTIPLATVLDWARPQGQAVVVLPRADHFFHSRLTALRALVTAWQPAGE